MLVPGATVKVAPCATVTFPVRVMLPDHVVLTVTVLSAAEMTGDSDIIKRRAVRARALRVRMTVR